MSDEKDDDKGRARFGDLEKKIVTDSINPGGKPDYLAQRTKRKQMRGLDDPRMVRGDESVPAVVPPSVLRGSVLGVVYLVVLAGFVWTGLNAVNMYTGTHGGGTAGRVDIAKCAPIDWKQPGSWIHPVATCTGFFVPTSQADLRKGIAVTDNVTVIGAPKSSAGKEITGAHMPSTGTTVYVSGWTGWIWWSVVALVLLLLLLFLTFRKHGVVPGARAILSARAERRARVHAQEQARERARELRKKRAAEAREKASAKKSGGKTPAKTGGTKASNGKAAAAKAAEDSNGKAADDSDDTATAPPAAKKPPAKKAAPRKKAKNPAHVGTVSGTARKVEPEDLADSDDTADTASSDDTAKDSAE
jgi:hypothetical protein